MAWRCIILVLVGASRHEFRVPEELLWPSSKYVQNLMPERQQLPLTGGPHIVVTLTMVLPDFAPVFFEKYVHWLHMGKICVWERTMPLAKVGLLLCRYDIGIRLEDPDYQDAVMDALVPALEETCDSAQLIQATYGDALWSICQRLFDSVPAATYANHLLLHYFARLEDILLGVPFQDQFFFNKIKIARGLDAIWPPSTIQAAADCCFHLHGLPTGVCYRKRFRLISSGSCCVWG